MTFIINGLSVLFDGSRPRICFARLIFVMVFCCYASLHAPVYYGYF